MTDRYPHHDATREDLRIQAKWARRLAVVYAAALILLVAFVAVSHMLAEPAPGFANDAAPHIAGAVTESTRRAE
jgi:hypothetical protein